MGESQMRNVQYSRHRNNDMSLTNRVIRAGDTRCPTHGPSISPHTRRESPVVSSPRCNVYPPGLPLAVVGRCQCRARTSSAVVSSVWSMCCSSMADPETPANPAAAETGAEAPALSCTALPSFSDACKLVHSRHSALMVTTHTRHITLSPKYLNKKRSGIKEHLDAELLRYSVGLDGVPVAYDNIKLLGGLGDIYDDLGYIHLNIQADFVVFQPQRGQTLVGSVNKVAPSHFGCLVHGCFNASIPKPYKLSAEVWKLIEVKIGDQMEFEVFQLDSDAVGVFCIRGRLSKKMEEEALQKFNEMSEEQTADAIASNEAETAPEEPDLEAAAVETPPIPSPGTKKKSKKRTFQETQNTPETAESKGETDLVLEEVPKKKHKKHKHQERGPENVSTEGDTTGEGLPIESTSLESSVDEPPKKPHKKKKHQDAVQREDTTQETPEMIFAHEPLTPVSETKKSKKKKSRHLSEHELSFQNGTTDTDIAESSILEESSGEPGAALETVHKKHKKKHKRSCKDQESTNGDVPTVCEQSQAEDIAPPEVTPKLKKHKRKHSDQTALESREKNNNMLPGDSEGFTEQTIKKKRR